MMGLGWQELAIVLVIILIIFGAGKLPEVARSLGMGVKEFKQEAAAPVGPGETSTNPATATVASETYGTVLQTEPTIGQPIETARTETAAAEATARDAI